MVTEDLYSGAREGETEVSRNATEKITSSDQFYTQHYTPNNRPFFIFTKYGDFLKGILLPGARDNSHINRSKSYRIELLEGRQQGKDLSVEEGRIEEFFTNRQLQRYIKKHELVGKMVRIVFIGRKKSGFGGHAAKVYRVFVDKGFIKVKESECYEPAKRKPGNRGKSVAGRRKKTRRKAGQTVRARTAS